MKTKKNTGIPFELLVQSIFQEINSQKDALTIEVIQNKILIGSAGVKHQIDVFWEFEVAGVRYSTVVQAKDWKAAVDQGEVLKFHSILRDLPGQPRGLMVSRRGFQSGAIKYAKSNGIRLMQIEDQPGMAIEIDIFGHAKMEILPTQSGRLIWRATTVTPTFSGWRIRADRARTNDMAKALIDGQSIELNISDIDVVDEQGLVITSMTKLLQSMCQEVVNAGVDEKEVVREFESGRFLRHRKSGKQIAAQTLSARVAITRKVLETLLKMPGVADFVLRDLLDGGKEHVSVSTAPQG